MAISATQTVRELATAVPNATRVFENLGIDYCCGGGKSLADACAQAKLSLSDVLQSLEQGGNNALPAAGEQPGFAEATLGELVSHIVSTHHSYVKQEIPRIQKLLSRVVAVHGRNHIELLEIQQVFAGLAAELTSHMMKEEMVLFPYVVQVEEATQSRRHAPRAPFGTVSNPVQMMEMEHESAGQALRKLQSLTSNYTAPADGCFTYNTVFTAMKDFEADLHQHIHLENNLLFPRAIAMEIALQQTA
jgi:regulator of cell morphogenesis and NO signaling